MNKEMFEELCRIEPELQELYEEAVHLRPQRGRNVDNLWYGVLKPKLVELVGFGAKKDGIIQSSKAYNTAYFVIYDALRGKKHEY